VSIVIPCYNAEKTILRTLISVFKSYYENIEIIAINDGSTDSTLSILNSLKSHDPRLHIINQKNCGVSAARNVGVNYSKSEFIAFLDSDDIFLQDCITVRMQIFEKENSKNLLGVFCPALLIDENLRVIYDAPLFDHKTSFNRVYFSTTSSCVFNPSCVIVKKSEFLKAGGFDPDLSSGEDYHLWHKMMRSGGYFRKTNSCFIGWVQHPNSATSENMHKHYIQCKKVINKIFSNETLDNKLNLCENFTYKESFSKYIHLETISNRALSSALIAVIQENIEIALIISADIHKSFFDKVTFNDIMHTIKFNAIKIKRISEIDWHIKGWHQIKPNIITYFKNLKKLPCTKNSDKIDLILKEFREYDESLSQFVPENKEIIKFENMKLRECIELFSVDLLKVHKKIMLYIINKCKKHNTTLGWHYLLDLVWVINNIKHIPEGSTILDAGAGNGILQFILSDMGYKVISVDFSDRTVPDTYKTDYNIMKIDSGKSYENEYIKYLHNEYKTANPDNNKLNYNTKISSLIKTTNNTTIIYYKSDISTLELIESFSVDCVVSISAIEHNNIEHISNCMKELKRVLKIGSPMFITTSATDSNTWFHEQSKGWCFSEKSLKLFLGINPETSNFHNYKILMDELCKCTFLKEQLAPHYFKSGNNGMPWGKWEPKYMPVGITLINSDNQDSKKFAHTVSNNKERNTPKTPQVDKKFSFFIDTTDGCNLRCSFCTRDNKKITIMNTSNFNNILGKIKTHIKKLQISCAWEYSIADNASEIVGAISEYNISDTTIYTNGQILPDKLINSIIKSKINNIVFSIGESEKETYEKLRKGANYEKLLYNIGKLNSEKKKMGSSLPKICSNLTILNSNIQQLPEFVHIAHHFGISEIRGRHLILNDGLDMDHEVITDINRANTILKSAQLKAEKLRITFNIPYYSNNYTEKKCKAPWEQFYITSKGDISICPRIHKYHSIGNIINQTLEDILNSKKYFEIQNEMTCKKFTNPVCPICIENNESSKYINQGF
jgi:radical SAM protein with 4Fe4S-binding SPASM domain